MVNKRIDYIDTLKCIAIFAVIAIHGLSLLGQVKLFGYKVGSFQQIFRFAVPLFLMITGALFLDKEIVLKDYLKNRFVRVLYPLLFFTLLLYITKTSDHILYYYWYSWMIVGVLLAVPVINKFIQYSDETEIKYYLAVFVLFSIFCQVCHIFNIKYALDISFFYTPVSFLVLGYYLFNKKINISPYKIIILSVVLFIISTIIKIKTGNIHFTNDFHSYLDLSVFQIIQVTSVFMFFKTIYESRKTFLYKLLEINTIKKFNLSISRASYGMYLVQHPLIYTVIPLFVKKMNWTTKGSVKFYIISVVCVFILSWIIVLILGKIPVIKKFSGYY